MAMHIQTSVPLAPLTTLKCGGVAEYLGEVTAESDLEEAVAFATEKNLPITILGGGSNVLMSDAGIKGLVIRVGIVGTVYEEDDTYVYALVGAGTVLDTFVEETVQKELWGVENLSGIPGSVGGVPIQNVGAYGVEAKDVVYEVRAYNMSTKKFETLSKEACVFTYRNSFFKTTVGKQYIVSRVTFRLSRQPSPRVSYKDLAALFGEETAPEQRAIRTAVLAIRGGKFPDWHTVGTAGSFFKNPIISREEYIALQTRLGDVPGYGDGDKVKVPLGWILDRVLSLKGYREGNVGLYTEQALVLVNHGGASSDEIQNFAERIRERVFDATHIRVEFEVVFVS